MQRIRTVRNHGHVQRRRWQPAPGRLQVQTLDEGPDRLLPTAFLGQAMQRKEHMNSKIKQPRSTGPKLYLGVPSAPPSLEAMPEVPAVLRGAVTVHPPRLVTQAPVEVALDRAEDPQVGQEFEPVLSILKMFAGILGIIAGMNEKVRIYLAPDTRMTVVPNSASAVVYPGFYGPWEYLLAFGPRVSAFELARGILTIQLDDEGYPSPMDSGTSVSWASVGLDLELNRRAAALGIDVAGPSDEARNDIWTAWPLLAASGSEEALKLLVENSLWPTNDVRLAQALHAEVSKAYPLAVWPADEMVGLLRDGGFATAETARASLAKLSDYLQGLGFKAIEAENLLERFEVEATL